jgi:very-short-patch-repair endonuclease
MSDAPINTARKLRGNATGTENVLWRQLRNRSLDGFKFRRQYPTGNYIVDFVCLEQRLIVEADGGQHMQSASDMKRDCWLNEQGFVILRFWNNEITTNLSGILETILCHLKAPSPGRFASTPSRYGERVQGRCSPENSPHP